MLKKFAAVAAMLSLAACGMPPNALKPAQRNAIFVKDATIGWSIDDAKKTANAEYVAAKDEFAQKLEAAVEQEFRSSPSGAEPVVFKVNVKNYSRVGAAMGNLIGGSNMVIADVTVARESDGQVLGVYEDVMGMHASNGGVIGLVAQAVTKPDIEQIMANSFAATMRKRFESK